MLGAPLQERLRISYKLLSSSGKHGASNKKLGPPRNYLVFIALNRRMPCSKDADCNASLLFGSVRDSGTVIDSPGSSVDAEAA